MECSVLLEALASELNLGLGLVSFPVTIDGIIIQNLFLKKSPWNSPNAEIMGSPNHCQFIACTFDSLPIHSKGDFTLPNFLNQLLTSISAPSFSLS